MNEHSTNPASQVGRSLSVFAIALVIVAGTTACGSSGSSGGSGTDAGSTTKSGGSSTPAPTREVRLEKPCRDLDAVKTAKALGVPKLFPGSELAPGDTYKDLEGKKKADFYSCYLSTYDAKHYKPGPTAYARIQLRDMTLPSTGKTKLAKTAKEAVQGYLKNSSDTFACTSHDLPESWGGEGGLVSCTQSSKDSYNRDAYSALIADFGKVRVSCTVGRYGDKPATKGESLADSAESVCTTALANITS